MQTLSKWGTESYGYGAETLLLGATWTSTMPTAIAAQPLPWSEESRWSALLRACATAVGSKGRCAVRASSNTSQHLDA